MTSTAAAEVPLPGVRGLVFLGFPLHASGRPGSQRAAHLRGDGFGQPAVDRLRGVERREERGAALRCKGLEGGM